MLTCTWCSVYSREATIRSVVFIPRKCGIYTYIHATCTCTYIHTCTYMFVQDTGEEMMAEDVKVLAVADPTKQVTSPSTTVLAVYIHVQV